MASLVLFIGLIASSTVKSLAEEEILCDVAIVGGGYAGLAAAHFLTTRHRLSVRVLEASNTTGGRTKNWDTSIQRPDVANDDVVELGGQWLGNKTVQPHSWRLVVEELGFEVFDAGYTPSDGNSVIFTSEGRKNFTDLISGFQQLPSPVQDELRHAAQILETLQTSVDLENPQSSPGAVEWDSMTFETWINATVSLRESRTILAVLCTTMIAQSPSVVSFLHILFYIRAAGGLENLVVNEQQYRVRGGTQAPPLKIASQLMSQRPFGSTVHLSSPVREIRQDESGITFRVEKEASSSLLPTPSSSTTFFTVRAKYAIVTGPPPTTGLGIIYKPPLPYDKRQLFQRLPMGNSVKFQAIFPRAFWRDKGWSGTVLASVSTNISLEEIIEEKEQARIQIPKELKQQGQQQTLKNSASSSSSSSILLSNCFDNSPYSGKKGVLLCFLEGDCSVKLMEKSHDERVQIVTSWLSQALGEEAKEEAIEYLDFNWAAQEHIGGAYSSYFPPGVWTQYGHALRSSFGRIYWAGADYALDGFGYINGAIESAERVVGEIGKRVVSENSH